MLVTEKNFQESLDFLQGCTIPLTCDTETNYVQHQEDRHIMGIAILGVQDDETRSFYFPFRHENTIKASEDDVNLPIEFLPLLILLILTKKTIWHNGKFDITQLEQECKTGFWEKHCWDNYFFYDTMLLSFMENENKYSHGLFDLGKLVGEKKLGNELESIAIKLGGEAPSHLKGKEAKEWSKTKGWQLIPPSVMGKYAEEDILITWKLFKLFLPRVEAEGYLEVNQETGIDLHSREIRVSHLIRKLEARGVLVDKEEIELLVSKTQHEMEQLQAELGFDPMKPSQLAHRLYAVPPEGLGFQPEAFSKRPSVEFSQGLPIMDEDTLARLLPNPVVEKVITYRGLVKAQSTWYQGWLDKVDSKSRLHPNFKQHGTVSTRWSCEKPNLQQLPRDNKNDKVKKLLRSTCGTQLWEFDYSQVEFRLGTVYANCEVILEAYRSGGDVHKITAQNIGAYNKFPDDPDRARYVGKQTNFLTIYGGGAKVLKKQLWRDARLDLPEKDCKVILDKFHTAYPEFRRVMAGCENSAKANGYIKMWNGRKRHFEHEYMCKDAFNNLVQGGAAQIMIESMLMLDKLGYQIVAQVHDSVWIELPEDSIEEEVKKVKQVMEWPSEDFDLPFPVDAKQLA